MTDRHPTRGASVSPDGSAFAHIIEVDGYPRAVQHSLTIVTGQPLVNGSRFVTLPVEGPVHKVLYSPDGRWLACQVDPDGGERSQVWVVNNDSADSQAWRVSDITDRNAELVAWDGDLVAITIEGDDGIGESRLVEPATGWVEVVDRRRSGRFVDSWSGIHLVREGPRCDQALVLIRDARQIPLLPPDPGSTTDPGRVLHEQPPGVVRVVARTDHGADRLHLVEVTLTAQGAQREVVAYRPGAELDDFTVSEDGSTGVLLWNVHGGLSELQLLSLPEGRLHEPIPLHAPVASEPSISRDGTLLAVTVEGPGLPRSVELYSTRSAQWLEITSPRQLPGPSLPLSGTVYARDGLELQGWLYHAPGFEAPGPVAVWFHGGPEGQSRPEYSYVFPTLLAAGISVYAPNVRGSAGFGRQFVHADDHDRRWAGITDGIDVAQALIASGLADPERIAAVGRSYGGYLTNALVAFHPGTFSAAVAICGMSDLTTFYAHTEPWIGAAAVSKYGDPVADADLLRQLSPLRRVEAIDVPVLTIHGSTDANVPVSESEQLVAALQERGQHARCVVLDGEGHEFTRPANRQRAAELIRDWLQAAWKT